MPKSQKQVGTACIFRRRLGGRSARVRSAALESAFELLIEQGSFTISEVAARAGLHETSIYRRWRNKKALALDACLCFADEAMPMPDTGALRADLIDLLTRISKLLGSPKGRAMLASSATLEPEAVTVRREFWRSRHINASRLIVRAVERGELPADTNAVEFLEALIAPLYFRAIVSMEPVDTWPIAAAIDQQIAGARVVKQAR